MARWVFLHGRPAGYTTDTLPESEGLYLPLSGGERTLGVLGIAPRAREPLAPSLRSVLELFTGQAALALERALLEEAAETSRLVAESERLRSTLLTSISHDLRTPLAAIAGAASGLAEEARITDPATRRELIETIREEVGVLSAIVQDLLDLTRLESGTLQLKREAWPVDELIASGVGRLEARLAGRPVQARLPEEIVAIEIDPVLVEQLLINLIENALRYTPAGSPIEIEADPSPEGVRVGVLDRGPGIPSGEEERIFEKFYRIDREKHVPGSGLGLPICRAIVTAHGGRFWAENRPGGGAAFRFVLPRPPDASRAVAGRA